MPKDLFHFFKKSPKAATNTKKEERVLKSLSNEGFVKNKSDSPSFVIGEIVWAKLGNFCWWPAMICEHPDLKKHLDNKKSEVRVHVQFFEDPPSWDWVFKRNVKQFDKREPSDETNDAFQRATEALKMSCKERIKQICACVPDNECNSSNEESVKFSKKRTKSNGGTQPRKRIKMSFDDSDDENNNKDEDDDSDNDDDVAYAPDVVSEDEEEDYKSEESDVSEEQEDEEEEEKLTKKRKRKAVSTPAEKNKEKRKSVLLECSFGTPNNTSFSKLPSTPMSNKLNSSISKAQSALSKFSSSSPIPSQASMLGDEQYVHFGLKFLQDGYRKDKTKKLHTDPDYDSRTLYVPDDYLKSKDVTPGIKQWWQLKRDLYDTVIFFKVGKFYELYHMDAVVGVKELGLTYMRGKFAHCGFPEIAFSRYSEVLIQRGYKVSRVEQTETPQALSARSGGKVVRREVCAVISKGTRTFSFMEGQSDENTSAYLLAFTERPCNDICLGGSLFGVCFVDTSIGKFHLGQFKDDRQCSRFLTMISQHPPVQVLYERNNISPKLQHILNHELLATIKDPLATGTEFWDACRTLKHLSETNYFSDENSSTPVEWPPLLKQMLSDGDTLGLEASESYQYAISSLGACAWYLKKCCIDQELLSMSKFEEYIPTDNITTKRTTKTTLPQCMILDGVALGNLDITINGDGNTEGTLLELLDHCTTSFGKRYFKQWLCSPSCSKKSIENRLNAIEDLMNLSDTMSEAQTLMKMMPDLERILRRVHSLGSLRRSQDHPDSRAIFYNEETYSKKKISDLLSAIEGFWKTTKIINLFQKQLPSISSTLLKVLLQNGDGNDIGEFPDLNGTLTMFQNAFDQKKAKETGIVHPKPGVHMEYDHALSDITSTKHKFDDYLKQQRKRLGCQTIVYWGTGNNRYQLEIPESALRSSTPNDYHLKSQKKGHKRFYSDHIESLIKELVQAEDRRDAALKDTMRNLFNKFGQQYALWEKALRCLSTLDCLMSLAFYSKNINGISCRPEIVDLVNEDGEEIQPFFEILNCRHPCLGHTLTEGDFIPNDIIVGKGSNDTSVKDPSCVLITGPNMGGKSTLMRQAGVLIIMAQLGCHVPAEVCRFTPVDRVFTRLGAHDRILHGESTFFVELSETSTIFQHATKHSLVLLDELGRGTATYDGTAIASAVVNELANTVGCRTLFSTHYHSLVDQFEHNKNIKLGYMACMVEKEDDDDDPTNETITFLYKFTSGTCPKSYGFNAAKLAGLPVSIIQTAHQKAKHFEKSTRNMRSLRSIFHGSSADIKQRLSLIQI